MIKTDNFYKKSAEIELSLKQEFINALKDEDFVKIVNKLKVDEDKAMKYTTRLMECSNELKNCSNCPGLENCKNKVRGFILSADNFNNNINFSYKSCHYTKKEEYKSNVVLFDVSNDIKNATLSNIYTDDIKRVEILKKIKSYYTNYFTDNKDKGIYLYGSFGVGKTYLISALFNELAKKNVKSIVVHVPELLRGLKASFDSDYKEKYDALKNAPLLLLDDIGAEYLTPWGRDEVLVPLLQYRMEQSLPTFFTSNLSLKELEEHFIISNKTVDNVINARRLIERISKLACEVELVSKNIRG